jgi:hypothetical protein
MGTWAKEEALFKLYNTTTGADDTGSYTVKVQPSDQAYPTGAVACSQLGATNTWRPDSNLDDQKHYDIYVTGAKIGRMLSPESLPSIGG